MVRWKKNILYNNRAHFLDTLSAAPSKLLSNHLLKRISAGQMKSFVCYHFIIVFPIHMPTCVRYSADLFPVLIFSHLIPRTWKGWRWGKMRTEEEARWQETTEGSEQRIEAEKVTGGYGYSPEGGATSQCLPVWDGTQKKRRESREEGS